MGSTPYLTQTDRPLFPDVLWSRPVLKGASGRLLLIGGHQHDFAALQTIYQEVEACGIGACTVVMPLSLQPLLGHIADTYFVSASPAGSIGRDATAKLLELSNDYDALSIGASLSNNSETAVAIERCLTESHKPTVLYLDALGIAAFSLRSQSGNFKTCLVLTMPELFKLAAKTSVPLNLKPELELLGRITLVQEFAASLGATIVYFGAEIIVANEHQVSVTPGINSSLQLAAIAAVSTFWTQNPTFESLSTAAFIIRAASQALPSDQASSLPQILAALRQAINID